MMEQNRRKVVELNIEDVLPNRFQPRIKFSEEAINELSKSIKEHGVIQPIVVRPIGDKFEIIAGERRYKATCMAGLNTIPALITDLNDKDSAEVALIENVQRENLTPIEEAISYRKILDMGYITQDALATKLGKTQSTIANKLRLLNLDDEVQEALLKEKISERHARSLLKLSDKEQQRLILKKIIAERLPVRRADEEINKLLNGEQIEETNEVVNNEANEEVKKFKFFNLDHQQETTEETQEEQEIKPGKFFNILNETEEEKGNINKNEEQENNNFENMFINPIITETKVNPSSINSRLLEEIEEIEKSINNSNKKVEETNDVKQDEQEEFDIEDIKIFDDNNFEDNEEKEDELINNEEKNNELINDEEKEKVEINDLKINNFKDVLQSIRNCSNRIEDSGFIIDTEEYDLDGVYQVVFKISKN